MLHVTCYMFHVNITCYFLHINIIFHIEYYVLYHINQIKHFTYVVTSHLLRDKTNEIPGAIYIYIYARTHTPAELPRLALEQKAVTRKNTISPVRNRFI